MQNLLNNIEIATIFLDNDLNIRRFTPQATKILNLIPADVGRPITHIVSNLKYKAMIDDIKSVIETLIFKEIQVETKDGCWYLMRIMPYRTIIYIFPTGVVFIIVIVHISKEIFERLFILATEVNKMIGGLMNYLRKSKIKGIKYKST